METVINIQNVQKIFGEAQVQVKALDNISFEVSKGEFLVIMGPSGSGKSTLLNLVGGLDTPTHGQVVLAGTQIKDMSPDILCEFRRDHIGFVFQSYNLIPVFSVFENVEYVLMLQKIPESKRRVLVSNILDRLGLKGMEKRMPHELSGGQQQRVAVARAIVGQPSIVLADEPTANLDSKTGYDLIRLMKELNEDNNITFVFSTHDPKIMEYAKRLIILKDGKIDKDEVR